MIKQPHIKNFKTKLEKISGSELSEQEANESFSNLSSFMQTLIEIDTSLKTKNKSNEHGNIRSSNNRN
jgi:hypothetical protein